jgi:membrane-bound metal-dependent hydrolase YbcI (DUF457 family)
MFILGHIGISLGAGILVNYIAGANKTSPSTKAGPVPTQDNPLGRKTVFSVARGLDLRFLMAGSMLPDIFDKPLGIFILGSSLSNGRIYCHTLFFLLVLALAGLWLFKSRKTGWLLAAAVGVFLHLVLDEMWKDPVTMYWPLLGAEFPRRHVVDWLADMLNMLLHNPSVYISELVGLAIVLCFLAILVTRDRVLDFVLGGNYTSGKRSGRSYEGLKQV